MDSRAKAIGRGIIAGLIGVALIGTVVLVLARGYANETAVVTQPIAFNHKLHITKAGLDCTTICHSAALSEVYAGLPSKNVCFECHDPDEETQEIPELARLAEYIKVNGDIPWKRVAITAPHVFFSHRRHVTSGQIACERCHPDVAESTQPFGRVAHVLPMDSCLDCHEHEGADVDCLACHR